MEKVWLVALFGLVALLSLEQGRTGEAFVLCLVAAMLWLLQAMGAWWKTIRLDEERVSSREKARRIAQNLEVRSLLTLRLKDLDDVIGTFNAIFKDLEKMEGRKIKMPGVAGTGRPGEAKLFYRRMKEEVIRKLVIDETSKALREMKTIPSTEGRLLRARKAVGLVDRAIRELWEGDTGPLEVRRREIIAGIRRDRKIGEAEGLERRVPGEEGRGTTGSPSG